MTTATLPKISCLGVPFEDGPDSFGEFRDANRIVGNAEVLRRRMQEDGYLFLRGLLDREEVLAARRESTRRLAERGLLVPGTDPMDGIFRVENSPAGPGAKVPPSEMGEITRLLVENNAPLMTVLYGGPMMAFFERFLGEAVRHFDFTWYRAILPHRYGTAPHSDIVYMGRGERERLFTAWTPMGDIDFEQGGLAILEGSNNHEGLRESYSKRDVDTYCANREDQRDEWGKGLNGVLAQDVARIRNAFGGRWLTSDFRAGDVVVFSTHTVHCGTDNNSERIRLSSDSRYQPASKPADERWIGPNPIAHGAGAKRGLIC